MERKQNVRQFLEDYKKSLNQLLSLIDSDVLEQVVTKLIETFRNGKTLYIAGNGGSAATASHMQADFAFFVRYFIKFRPKVRALTDNVPLITAVGNDTSFYDIFVEQMKGNFEAGDTIICISASGNSENVIRAAEYANNNGGTSIGFMGFEGGRLKNVCRIALFTPNPKGEYGPIEDIHMILDHILVNYITRDEEFLALS
ncbi:MAG: Phosphoheptose isomerase [Bacteroidetes bacterium ADurb.Bin408]|nr:MAG: Phosphoheptose isomerase [Bacteroidetes bacterium ADurb.Bin408]